MSWLRKFYCRLTRRGAVLSAQSIRWMEVVEPCVPSGVDSKGDSYGLGPCTYDVRIAEDLTIYPQKFKLSHTVENFRLPNDICMEVMEKSSLIRRGLKVHNTHADAGWEGNLTLELELANVDQPLTLKKGDAVAQVKFEWLDRPTVRPYKGKYQNQEARPVESRSYLSPREENVYNLLGTKNGEKSL